MDNNQNPPAQSSTGQNDSGKQAVPGQSAIPQPAMTNAMNAGTVANAETQKQEPQERVFEFTSDLNIAPVKNPEEEPAVSSEIPPGQKPVTPLQEAVAKINIETKSPYGESVDARKTAAQPPAAPQPAETQNQRIAAMVNTAAASEEKEKALRTYESDIAEALARKKTSTASIVIAEQEKKERERMDRERIEREKLEQEKERREKEEMERRRKAIDMKQAQLTIENQPVQNPISEQVPESQTFIPQVVVQQQAEQRQEVQESGEHVQKTGQRNHSAKKLFLLLVSMIFILGGIIAAYYLYSLSPLAVKKPVPQTQTSRKSIVMADSRAEIAADNLTADQILGKIRDEMAKPQAPSTVKEIVLNLKKNNQPVAMTSSEAAAIMGVKAPDMLLRSLSPEWMLGVYADQNDNKDAFVIATQDFFQNSFAGMLLWENSMAGDFERYLRVTAAPESDPAGQNPLPAGHFTDGIVMNKDVREFLSEDGSVLFLYSFVDNRKLVITSRESTLAEIVARLERQAYMR